LESAYPESEQPGDEWSSTHWVWTGLRKTKNNRKKKHGPYNPDDWQWADGKHPIDNFHKWLNRAQPDQNTMANGNGDCHEEPMCYQNHLRINHMGLWDDTYKFKTHPYACDYQGKYLLFREPTTRDAAKEACERASLSLALVRNPGEVKEMLAAMDHFLGKADSTWTTGDNRNWVWLGRKDIKEKGLWKWPGDSPEVGWKMPWRVIHVIAISRWGEFDDSYQENDSRVRPFACQCPNQ
jgi:hypothetical protein